MVVRFVFVYARVLECVEQILDRIRLRRLSGILVICIVEFIICIVEFIICIVEFIIFDSAGYDGSDGPGGGS